MMLLKKSLTFILAVVMILVMFQGEAALAAEEIGIVIDLADFNNANTSGSSGSTLLLTTGNATASGGALQLTSSSMGQVGTVVRRNQVQLTDGFSTYFQFVIDQPSHPGWAGRDIHADGLSFFIYKNDTAQTGSSGGGLGYSGIDDSIAVEFDTYYNDTSHDPRDGSDSHVAIMQDGNADHTDQPAGSCANYASMTDNTINVWVDYDGTTVTTTYGTSTDKSSSSNSTLSRSVGSTLVGSNVFVGFSASTGSLYSRHRILKWYFKDAYKTGGLNPEDGAYVQAASTVGVALDAAINPTDATIQLYDATGTVMTGTADIYLDDVLVADDASLTASGYVYSMPASLGNGSHKIRAVAPGGASNYADFTVEAATYTATVNTKVNGVAADVAGTVDLKQGGTTVATAADSGTGVYTADMVNGMYDVYINGEDTGGNITIDGAASSVTENYYTVSFSVTDAGTASGSTVSATAGIAAITSGTAVLDGKTVVITAAGAGATAYAYAWLGDGTSGETTAELTIASLSSAIDADCTVTGTTTYTATINTRVNGAATDVTGSVELKQSGTTVATASDSGTGAYTASVANGTYDIFIGGKDTDVDLIINGAANSATVNYYTVNFSVTDTGAAFGSTISATAGGAAITNGTKVLAGKAVVINASGAGAATYTYAWSGNGTSGETTGVVSIASLGGSVDATCIVTGSALSGNAPPAVATNTVSNVTTSGVILSGNVVSSGGSEVTERGFVYSTATNPVIGGADVKRIMVDSGTDDFTVTLTGLSANTTYYVRAYAINSEGMAYGEVISFKTDKDDLDDIPETGDNSFTLIWWLLCGISAAGIVALTLLGKRKRIYKR